MDLKNIDVAKIMAEITVEAEKRYSDAALNEKRRRECNQYFDDEKYLLLSIDSNENIINGKLCHGIKERNHILANKAAEIRSYGDIPWMTPDYGWRSLFIRIPFKFISKVVSKLTRFITIRQKDANESVTQSLELLQASVLSTADWSLEIEKRLCELTDIANNLSACLDGQRYKIKQIYDAINVDISDEMYLAFEEQFRGSQEDIRKKQSYYLDDFIKGNLNANTVGMILDLGCGRGEWLALLRDNGYQGIGVDLNEESLKCCAQNGIETVQMDVVDYLKTLPRESVKLLTSFQLIEHMTTNRLIELFQEIGRVVRPDGMIIFETPNPVNVNVGAASFYLDPTHKRQIHPEFLKFLAEQNGLHNMELAYWQQRDIDSWWNSVWKKDTTNLTDSNIYRSIEETLKKSLWSPADYALIARK